MMIKRLAAFLAAIMCVHTVFAEDWSIFKEETEIVFAGGSELADNAFTRGVSEYIEKNHNTRVNTKYISAGTDAEKYSSADELKGADIIFGDFGKSGADLVSVERTVRAILADNKNCVIIALNMPNRSMDIDYSDMNELLESYGIPIADIEDYFSKRIDIGILSADEIFSGNTLNEKGLLMAAECINNVYDKMIYRYPVYRKDAINFSDVTKDDGTDKPEKEFGEEDARRITKSAIVADIYSNEIAVNNERKAADKKNSEIKPAKKGEMIMLPIRFLKDGLGIKISYNNAGGKITLKGKSKSLTLKTGETDAELNGEAFTLKETPIRYGSVTYIPADAAAAVCDMNYFISEDILIMYTGNVNENELVKTAEWIRMGAAEK